MTSFNDREAAFENKFKHDKELEFKVNSRREPDGDRARGYHAADLASVWTSMGVAAPAVVRPVPERSPHGTGRTGRTVRTGPQSDPQPSGSSASASPSGSTGETPTEPDACQVCGEPMHPSVTAGGYRTHPTCEVA